MATRQDIQSEIDRLQQLINAGLDTLSQSDKDLLYTKLKEYEAQLTLASTNNSPIITTAAHVGMDNKITTLRSFQHAKKIFIDGNFRLSPKYGFLYYVEFDFNPLVTNLNNVTAQEMGMVVKAVQLPKFTIQVKEHNAYNRKNYVQNKITYDPISISFHDDQADNVRNFWYDYYSYYYRDPDYADATYQAFTKYQSRPTFDWGYSPRPAVGYNNSLGQQPYQYIQNIRIYSMYQGQFDEYNLINPIITNFKHGEHSNSGTGEATMQHDMTVQFEAVKYLTGYVTEETAGGFITLNYDKTPSPNGGTPKYQTGDTQIIDSANSNTAINPQLRMAQALQTTNQSTPTSYSLGGATTSAGNSPTNSGGYAIPSLGSLTQGLTNGAMIGQQLGAVGASLAGQTASQLANGVTGQVAAAIGKNGQQVIGLVAAAIANPKATLQTIQNMATSLALGIAVNYAQQQILGPGVKAVTDFTGGVIGDIKGGVQNLVGGDPSKATFDSGQSIVVNPSGSGTLYNPDGTVQLTYPNGTFNYDDVTNFSRQQLTATNFGLDLNQAVRDGFIDSTGQLTNAGIGNLFPNSAYGDGAGNSGPLGSDTGDY